MYTYMYSLISFERVYLCFRIEVTSYSDKARLEHVSELREIHQFVVVVSVFES